MRFRNSSSQTEKCKDGPWVTLVLSDHFSHYCRPAGPQLCFFFRAPVSFLAVVLVRRGLRLVSLCWHEADRDLTSFRIVGASALFAFVEELDDEVFLRRLTLHNLGFSRKVENMKLAIALHFAYYTSVAFKTSLWYSHNRRGCGTSGKYWIYCDSLECRIYKMNGSETSRWNICTIHILELSEGGCL